MTARSSFTSATNIRPSPMPHTQWHSLLCLFQRVSLVSSARRSRIASSEARRPPRGTTRLISLANEGELDRSASAALRVADEVRELDVCRDIVTPVRKRDQVINSRCLWMRHYLVHRNALAADAAQVVVPLGDLGQGVRLRLGPTLKGSAFSVGSPAFFALAFGLVSLAVLLIPRWPGRAADCAGLIIRSIAEAAA